MYVITVRGGWTFCVIKSIYRIEPAEIIKKKGLYDNATLSLFYSSDILISEDIFLFQFNYRTYLL